MKLQFTHQPFQDDAMRAVVDLFEGQPPLQRLAVQTGGVLFDTVANRLTLPGEAIQANLNAIQKRNRLPLTYDAASRNVCVEMETGTGKTYVYTKTIYELNRLFGFSKFIVVVPSIAIREGVQKSFEITHEHFQRLYDNQPIRWFIYNSQRLGNVRDFAESTGIEVMIINIDAFRKSENVINQELDRMNSGRAIDLIRDTNPIVIIDEPQSVDGTPKAKEAIQSLSPLFILRYSATHREKINPVYRLTPVDAYQQGLVKQIAVSSIRAMDDFNQPYIRLLSVDSANGFKARIELDAKAKSGKVARSACTVKLNSDLYIGSGEREMYRDWKITDIDCTPGLEKIELNGSHVLMLGRAMGGIPDAQIKRAQIHKTIELHLDKELRLMERGIKVLSLFFIDRVERYRLYDGDAVEQGEYARMFEEEYAKLIQRPQYRPILDRLPRAADAHTAHDGYFSMDKKGRLKNTRGDTSDDQSTYELIMRDKERLLSMDEPLRFIFSHSALKEGWDNPNVFQVCTLLEQASALTCRQKIGRGLRLCVNSDGERVMDRQTNSLHIVASESFAEFATGLQGEIEKETGVKFGVLDVSSFMDIEVPVELARKMGLTIPEAPPLELPTFVPKPKPEAPEPVQYRNEEKEPAPEAAQPAQPAFVKTTYEDSMKILEAFKQQGLVSDAGTIKPELKEKIEQGTFELPEVYQPIQNAVIDRVRQANEKIEIRNDANRVTVRKKKQVFVSREFTAIWDRIKHKTTYRVQRDMEQYVTMAAERIKLMPPIQKARIVSTTATIDVQKAGVKVHETHVRQMDVGQQEVSLPNLPELLRDATKLSKRTILRILIGSGRLTDFANNPELFVEQVTEILTELGSAMQVDGIRYQRIAGKEYYVQEVFDKDELTAYLDSGAVKVERSVYDYAVVDSMGVEKRFAEALDSDSDVKLFFKLPDKFEIETPIGNYRPDWAVVVDMKGEGEKLYFVIETKGSLSKLDLRGKEDLKIQYGRKHFEALGGAEFELAKDWREFKKKQG